MADQVNLVQAKADNIALVLYCLGILSGVVEVLQFIKQQGSGSGREGLPQGKIVALSLSISLIASAASLALHPLYNTICCRLCFLFSVFSCAFLLSPLVPIKLFWVPYFACVFPFLHLLQLLPAPLQQFLQQLQWATCKTIRDAACRAHQAIVRAFEALVPTRSSSVTSNNNPGRSTSSSSSSASALARIIEEGDPQVINVNNNTSCGGGDI